MLSKNNTILKINTANLQGNASLFVSCEKEILSLSLEVKELCGARAFKFTFLGNGNSLSGSFGIPDPRLWSYQTPDLYAYRADLAFADGSAETIEGRFGFRTISTDGKHVCLNGTPVFIRGFIRGATAHDHSNTCALSEEEFYRKNIRAAKRFGFNFVRFHSVVPNETYFKVADEEGILVHVELRKPEDIYNNLREMTNTGNMVVPDDYLRETTRRLFEHPSLCVYCIGNEIRNLASSARVDEIYNVIRSEDTTRLFLDTCAWGENGRKNVDLDVQHMSYYFPYGAHADMYENTENLLVVGSDESRPLVAEGENSYLTRELTFSVPLIAHEVCHYTALRDYKTLREKFVRYGTPLPWWVDEELKMIERKGYADRYEKMYRASKRFQLQCWKTAYEAMRSSRLLGGFHFLQFADTDVYENSNGVVDCFDDENAVSPRDFLRFNADRVLLSDLGRRIFTAGETVITRVSLSNYSEEKDALADLCYSLTDEHGNVAARGVLKNVDVSRKGLYVLGKLHLHLPECVSSQKLTLSVSLLSGEKQIAANEWDIWSYKKRPFVSYEQFTSIDEGDIVVTSDVEKAFSSLKEGKRVCLVYRNAWTRHVKEKEATPRPKYAFRASWNRFKPVIWDRGTNYGGICADATLNKYGFATDELYDFNYGVISEDCDKINLDDFPCKVTSLVSGIDKSCRDRFDASREYFNFPELMYAWTLRDFSYLFELCVGAGKLLVCGFNLTGLDENEPSTTALAQFIRSYLRSDDFSPKYGVDEETLRAYMADCARSPVKESMMTQFWALDDAPVESKLFWKQSREYLFDRRSDEVK